MIRYSPASICSLALTAVFAAGTAADAQTELNGAWEAVEAWGHNADGEWTDENPQPSLTLFLDGHYSIMYVFGEEARPLMPEDASRSSITDEQMRSIFMTFVANSGTYEVEGSTITTRPMVALWPNFMEGGSATYNYRIDDGALILTTGGEGWEAHTKLRRLE